MALAPLQQQLLLQVHDLVLVGVLDRLEDVADLKVLLRLLLAVLLLLAEDLLLLELEDHLLAGK